MERRAQPCQQSFAPGHSQAAPCGQTKRHQTDRLQRKAGCNQLQQRDLITNQFCQPVCQRSDQAEPHHEGHAEQRFVRHWVGICHGAWCQKPTRWERGNRRAKGALPPGLSGLPPGVFSPRRRHNGPVGTDWRRRRAPVKYGQRIPEILPCMKVSCAC